METVIGAFDDKASAQRAMERLVQAGFDRQDVHIQESDSTESTQTPRAGNSDGQEREVAADRGLFGGFFANLFGDDDQSAYSADTYAEAVRRGSSVVVVDAQDETQAERAASLLHELGAIDVDERAKQWRASGWKGQTIGDQGKLDVVQEELKVGKRALDRGGVRVIQRVSQKPVREIVRLREEHATVDRKAVNRPATAEDLSNFKEGTMEVREMTEEPVVSKTARVVEEVRVGKEVREREQTVQDTVRRKDVDVERLEGEAGSGAAERERAVARDRSGKQPLTEREPDVTGTTPRGTRKSSKDKPTR
jgi:stress response protein YsnF